MKTTQVFYNGKKYKKIYVGMTKFQVFKIKFIKFMKLVMITSFVAGVGYGSFHIGRNTADPKIVKAYQEVIKEVDGPSPVMDRIAKCESSAQHLDKNGQVQININTNHTIDIGLYQINSIWEAQATKLGLNLYNEADNKAFAMWLYKNKGTGAWSASSKCWNK